MSPPPKPSIDLKGFDHVGVPWSWPDVDESMSVMLRPAHAHIGQAGTTACGKPWPHRYVFEEKTRRYRLQVDQILDGDGDVVRSEIATRGPVRADLADHEKRIKYLCAACLRAVRRATEIGPES